MVRNLTTHVEHIRERVRQAYPEGVDEQSYKDIPVLLTRIAELENALVPFAHQGNMDNFGKPMVEVRHADCQKAALILQTDYQPDKKINDFYYPA
jgi:uncharacterized protein YdhG (YjbR/CyaY superfamily)